MTTVRHIIQELGGARAVSELLQVSGSCVRNWVQRGFPKRRCAHLATVAAMRGLTLSPSDFRDAIAEPPRRKRK